MTLGLSIYQHHDAPEPIEEDDEMTNLCVRCEKGTGINVGMVTVVNPYHNGPRWIDVCTDCIRLGDRVVGPDDETDDDDMDAAFPEQSSFPSD